MRRGSRGQTVSEYLIAAFWLVFLFAVLTDVPGRLVSAILDRREAAQRLQSLPSP
ncbi:MAG: hypothetical protein V1495_03060 [Pseudomonadota bacterium]